MTDCVMSKLPHFATIFACCAAFAFAALVDSAGYRASSVLTYAAQLQRPLLLIHGLTDDNVYFQHTLQLANALFLAGKTYEFMPMLGTHMAGAEAPVVKLREEQRVMEFFHRALQP